MLNRQMFSKAFGNILPKGMLIGGPSSKGKILLMENHFSQVPGLSPRVVLLGLELGAPKA